MPGAYWLMAKPDVVCIQETWLKPTLDFVVHTVIRKSQIMEEEEVLHSSNTKFHIGYWKRGIIRNK